MTWSVKHYFITVLIGFGVFAASIWSITLLPQGFLPAQDSARSLLAIELPPGTQLSYTEKVTEDIVSRLRKRSEVKSIFVDGGRVPPGTQEVRRAALIINYTPKDDRDITQRELEFSVSQELENIPDIRFWFLDENGLRAISLVVTGADANIVNNVASELATQMKRDSDHLERDLGNRAGTPRTAHRAAGRSRRAAGRLDRKPVADHPGRDHRRCRSRACQVRRRRPPGTSPRAARGRRPR
ncbi:multidrug efflux pump subunit AcrB [Bradyrhizobium sp. LM2.7]